MKKTKDNIRIKIITPLVIMLFLFSVVLVFAGYKLQNKHLSDEITTKALAVDKLFSRLLESESKFMTAQLQFIANDPGLITAWQAQDRSELFDRANIIFKKINNEFNVTRAFCKMFH